MRSASLLVLLSVLASVAVATNGSACFVNSTGLNSTFSDDFVTGYRVCGDSLALLISGNGDSEPISIDSVMGAVTGIFETFSAYSSNSDCADIPDTHLTLTANWYAQQQQFNLSEQTTKFQSYLNGHALADGCLVLLLTDYYRIPTPRCDARVNRSTCLPVPYDGEHKSFRLGSIRIPVPHAKSGAHSCIQDGECNALNTICASYLDDANYQPVTMEYATGLSDAWCGCLNIGGENDPLQCAWFETPNFFTRFRFIFAIGFCAVSVVLLYALYRCCCSRKPLPTHTAPRMADAPAYSPVQLA